MGDAPRLPARARRRCSGSPRRRCRTRCATPSAERIEVRLEGDATAALVPVGRRRRRRLRPGRRRAVRGRRLGLTSMEERATELGGTLDDRARRSGEGTHGAAGGGGVIRVLLADDHAVVRQGLRTFLDLQDDIEVVAEAGDGEAAVDAARAHAARRDPARPRDAAARRRRRAASGCARRRPRARVIVLTSFGDDDKLFAGAARGRGRLPAQGRRAAPSSCARSAPRTPATRRSRPTIAARVVEEIAQRRRRARRGRRPDPARARGAVPDRPRPLEQGDRARARRGGEDGQDPRLAHPRQARPHRPHAGRALRRPRRASSSPGS